MVWANENLPSAKPEIAAVGGLCQNMRRKLAHWLNRVEKSATSHDILINGHWNIIKFALEGHVGWQIACDELEKAWLDDVRARQKRTATEVGKEIFRSRINALRKVKAEIDAGIEVGVNLVGVDTCWVSDKTAKISSPDTGARDGEGRLKMAPRDAGDEQPPSNDHIPTTTVTNPPRDYLQNDDGNAHYLTDLHSGLLRYDVDTGEWVIWNNERWFSDTKFIVVDLFRRVADAYDSYGRHLLDQADKAKMANGGQDTAQSKVIRKEGNRWRDWAKQSGNTNRVRGALTQAQAIPGIATHMAEWDSDDLKVGVSNGVLMFRKKNSFDPNRKLMAHIQPAKVKKEWMLRLNTNVEYVPWSKQETSDNEKIKTAFELFNDYLNRFIPDLELREFVQRVAGYVLLGSNPEQLLFYFYGPSKAGKSTIVNLIAETMGEYATVVSNDIFKSQQFNTDLLTAMNKRLAHASESGGEEVDANLFKALMGDEAVPVKVKHSNKMMKMKPKFTMIVSTNSPPKIKNADKAVENRIGSIPFKHVINPSEDDPMANSFLAQHGKTAMLAWMVEGAKRYLQIGLRPDTWPAQVKMETKKFVAELDDFNQFIDNNFERGKFRLEDKQFCVAVTTAFQMYNLWCEKNQIKKSISSPNSFKNKLTDMGIASKVVKIDGVSTRCYVGIKKLTKVAKHSSG